MEMQDDGTQVTAFSSTLMVDIVEDIQDEDQTVIEEGDQDIIDQQIAD